MAENTALLDLGAPTSAAPSANTIGSRREFIDLALPLPCTSKKRPSAVRPENLSVSPPGQRTETCSISAFLPSPKWTHFEFCAKKPSPALKVLTSRRDSSRSTTSTRAPMASRLQVVPRSRRAMKWWSPGTSLRRKRTCGALRFDIQRSRSPSLSQSTCTIARPSSLKSRCVAEETLAKRGPPVLRKQQFRSCPLNDRP